MAVFGFSVLLHPYLLLSFYLHNCGKVFYPQLDVYVGSIVFCAMVVTIAD